MRSRIVMLVDFDYFFAQCEERRNPSLKDRPVVVCVYSGRTEDSGAVSTANYVARKYGVKSGMPIFLAKRKLAEVDAVFLSVDRLFYEEVSNNIMSILRHYADSFEQVGIDEAYLDVTERVNGSFEEAGKLAQRIMDEVKLREKITVSIGVGPNKLVAKIAAGFRKPNGLTVVTPQQTQSFLAPLPVDRLLGVGKKTSEKMETLGIKTIGDLSRFDVQKLIATFGQTLGTYFHYAALGEDDSPVLEKGKAQSMSRISTLKEDTRDIATIMRSVGALCEDIYTSLKQKGLEFKTVSAIAVLKDMNVRSRSKTFESPVSHLELFRKSVEELFQRLIGETNLEIRRAGVKVSGFSEKPEKQRRLTDF
ncbi:DNA polymerase IV [Candidatus Bathyarchaeota archaeon]|nr:DNA polymerase IV [Candidatus Bathyarchaeota archaeon]